ncbi:MAG: hypothetical protein ACXAEU_14900 [Candidatus Hodarchaeales archaeon]
MIGETEIKEKCGTCKKPLLLTTYLDTTTKKRFYRGTCKKCHYSVDLKENAVAKWLEFDRKN